MKKPRWRKLGGGQKKGSATMAKVIIRGNRTRRRRVKVTLAGRNR